MTGLRPVRTVIFAAIAVGCAGLALCSFASDSGTRQNGGIPMASNTAADLDGAWIVQKVKDIDLTPFEDLRFDFDDGTLYGSSPCRSFTTTFGPDIENLMLSPLQFGGGLCDEDTMISERNFFQQISLVNRMEITESGVLVMYNFEQPLLWAKKLTG
ncbi:META domain-containing protein [Leisingera daeponensis]|uniref:META domain-containing protein n=1 Tax=Leisingera daeponensis TaxID=405746 RepID=A0ABS7NFZ8_9RHOB|nr:META domain-containing protein [Leisingera daeponensis]MBY6140130.1 META domain-containing protein [Leisingera daeponensis]